MSLAYHRTAGDGGFLKARPGRPDEPYLQHATCNSAMFIPSFILLLITWPAVMRFLFQSGPGRGG
jgi:hypothetical protein